MGDKIKLWFQVIFPILTALFCGAMLLLFSLDPYYRLSSCFYVSYMENQFISYKGDLSGLTVIHSDIEPNYDADLFENGDITLPDYGSQYALLTSEKGDLYVPIYWGSGSELLKKGGCQMPSSAFIGSNGNTVISAHVNTFFHELDQLKAGDAVMLYTDYGQFTYTVIENITFNADDMKHLKKTDDSRLTLYTCTKNYLAESPKRVGVVCRLDKKAFYTEKVEETE